MHIKCVRVFWLKTFRNCFINHSPLLGLGEGVVSEVHSNKILIRRTPSQIDFIEQQKLGRVKEAPILWMMCTDGLFLEKVSVADRNKQTRFRKITGWLQNAIHDMHMDIIG